MAGLIWLWETVHAKSSCVAPVEDCRVRSPNDYFVASENMKERLVDAKIHTEIMGSDHCPVELTIK